MLLVVLYNLPLLLFINMSPKFLRFTNKMKGSFCFIKFPFLLSMLLFGIGFLYGFIIIFFDIQGVVFSNYSGGIDYEKLSQVTWHYVLTNNLKVILLLILGMFLLGIPTMLTLFFNGVTFGELEAYALITPTFGINLQALIWPHGVFECVGMLLAGAVGLVLPYRIFRYIQKGENILILSQCKYLMLITLLSLLLTIIAAYIEINITKSIALGVIQR